MPIHVLRNRFGIQDQEALEIAERELTRWRLSQGLPEGNLDATHLQAIHRHLFQDVYDWAGELRLVEMTKETAIDGKDTLFCPTEFIVPEIVRVFDDLSADYHLVGLKPREFADRAGHYLCEINAIHPFREGNGRTQRAFLSLLAEEAGHPLDMTKIDPHEMIAASIQGVQGDELPMAKVIYNALRRERERAAEAERHRATRERHIRAAYQALAQRNDGYEKE